MRLVLGDEAPAIDGELVVGLALVEARVLRHGGVDLQLALLQVGGQAPLADLKSINALLCTMSRYCSPERNWTK